ncbi:unnamed protein product [Pleuronectes platessa]|uniref:Uncharacterized protein n=1 Tax=Pleuronectes platessa TaxID=8262 RepID=A0A9N7YYK4_PLEPL|nr:unnamed protein product [Pleuronectes platessa]
MKQQLYLADGASVALSSQRSNHASTHRRAPETSLVRITFVNVTDLPLPPHQSAGWSTALYFVALAAVGRPCAGREGEGGSGSDNRGGSVSGEDRRAEESPRGSEICGIC